MQGLPPIVDRGGTSAKKTIKLLLQGEAGPVMRIESVQILLPFYFSGDVLLS